MADDDAGASFLTRVHGKFPMWVWIAFGVAAVLMYRSISGNSKKATTSTNYNQTTGNNGNMSPPNIFYLPQGAGGSNVTVNVNRQPGNGNTLLPFIEPASAAFIPPRATPAPATKPEVVTVQKWPGVSSGGLAEWDTTLWGIANHFGTTVENLQTLNHITNPNLIYPGEQIEVN